MAYGEPIEANATVDLNSEWMPDSEDSNYTYFKSNSIEFEPPFSQCKVTWSGQTSVTFKYMSSSSSEVGVLFVLKLDREKFTNQSSEDDIYMVSYGVIPGTYNEFTIECDEGEHHIWFVYAKNPESATDEDRGFIGVPKYVSPILDVKQGSELPIEYKSGGISVENGKTYDINFKNVILPNGSNILPSYEDYTKTEKTITYEYVDLGLSSGLKWATCNIGATSETDYGVYFQWGETNGVSGSLVGKYSDENYSWATAPFNGGYSEYNTDAFNQVKDTVCPNGILAKKYDTASQIMGSDWRMPTQTELQELLNGTTNEWFADYNGTGVSGRKFTSKTDETKYIFIPAAGNCYNGPVDIVGHNGYVWSSSLNTSDPYDAWDLYFGSGHCYMNGYNHCYGLSVRGVRK